MASTQQDTTLGGNPDGERQQERTVQEQPNGTGTVNLALSNVSGQTALPSGSSGLAPDGAPALAGNNSSGGVGAAADHQSLLQQMLGFSQALQALDANLSAQALHHSVASMRNEVQQIYAVYHDKVVDCVAQLPIHQEAIKREKGVASSLVKGTACLQVVLDRHPELLEQHPLLKEALDNLGQSDNACFCNITV